MIPQALRYLTPPLLTQLDTHGHVRHLSRLCDYHLSAIILLHWLFLCQLIFEVDWPLCDWYVILSWFVWRDVIVEDESGLAVSKGLLLLLIGIVFHFKDLLPVHIHILEIVSCQNRIEFLSELHISLSRLWVVIILSLTILLQNSRCIY